VPVRVGIDLVAVESVRASLREHGDRYLARVYTEQEVADCGGADGPDAERLAARFAAKEAALKVLRPAGGGVSWHAIEVIRDEAGWADLKVTGAAAELARQAGIVAFAVSLTHEGAYASAVVVAELETGGREPG
jgi:holo-[acyl-carrier protein] synthase